MVLILVHLIGNKVTYCEFTKEELEECIASTSRKILLISTACYSSGWTVLHWTLLAAAAENQEAPSMTVSQVLSTSAN